MPLRGVLSRSPKGFLGVSFEGIHKGFEVFLQDPLSLQLKGFFRVFFFMRLLRGFSEVYVKALKVFC